MNESRAWRVEGSTRFQDNRGVHHTWDTANKAVGCKAYVNEGGKLLDQVHGAVGALRGRFPLDWKLVRSWAQSYSR